MYAYDCYWGTWLRVLFRTHTHLYSFIGKLSMYGVHMYVNSIGICICIYGRKSFLRNDTLRR